MDPATTDPPRLSKGALFRVLGYTPHAGQILLHRSRARFRVLACGTRWGKSTAAGMEALAALLEPRDRAVGWLVAPTYDVCQRIYIRLCSVITEKLRHRVVELSPREQKIVVTNLGGGTSELRCKSADHPVSLLGEALDFLIVDEAATMRNEIWEDHLAPRLLDRKGWALVISTPQGAGWFYEMYRRGRKGRDPECESWASPSSDNPHVDAALIEAERGRMSAEKFAQQYGAEFLDVPRDPCEQCGAAPAGGPGPHGIPPGTEYEAVPKCPSCGIVVNSEGRCVVKYHNAWAASLWLDGGYEAALFSWNSWNADGNWK